MERKKKILIVEDESMAGFGSRKTMRRESAYSPKSRTSLRNDLLLIKKKSNRPMCWLLSEMATVWSLPILFIVAFMLLSGGLSSSVCSATSNPPQVRVGTELDFPPYAFLDEEGQPAGFSIDLIKAVSETMGLSIKISAGSWDNVWKALVAGELHILPIVAKLPERQDLVDFSLPHTETYDTFFVRRGDPPIVNIAAARGMTIVVMQSDAAHHGLLAHNFQGNLILVDTIPEGLRLVSSGKHNAFLCSKLIGTLLIKEHGLSGLAAGPIIPDYKRVFSFAVRKGDMNLMEKLNQGLLIVKTNGEYDRIYDKWLTFDDPWRQMRKYLFPATIMVIAIALIAGIWIATLQRQIKSRNSEIAKRKQAEESLRLQSEIVANMSQGVYLVRIRDLQIVYTNPVFEKMFGYDPGEMLGRDVSVVNTPTDMTSQETVNRIVGILKEDRTWQGEIQNIKKDGTLFWCYASAVLYDHPEYGEIIIAIHTDISERRQAEEQIRTSLKEKEVLLRELYHRTKNNMQMIISMLHLQSESIDDRNLLEIFKETENRISAGRSRRRIRGRPRGRPARSCLQ
ncbi:MAG: transporter substrate-binding domain-containing protein [Desulfobacterales bacterium]